MFLENSYKAHSVLPDTQTSIVFSPKYNIQIVRRSINPHHFHLIAEPLYVTIRQRWGSRFFLVLLEDRFFSRMCCLSVNVPNFVQFDPFVNPQLEVKDLFRFVRRNRINQSANYVSYNETSQSPTKTLATISSHSVSLCKKSHSERNHNSQER